MELVAPAGDLSKLKYAFAHGADAVYCGLPEFSLRTRVNSMNYRDLAAGVNFAHAQRKKIYFTYNIYPHNNLLRKLEKELFRAVKLKPDALVVADPGVLAVVRRSYPRLPIHLSTQANAINYGAVSFWKQQGIARVILARETTIAEAREIKKKVPGIELEYFVHGAMCMAYSGRCLLSSWINGRSANLGDCTQPCRWPWIASELETKSGSVVRLREKSPVGKSGRKPIEAELYEKPGGDSYILNSKDLCLIAHLDKLSQSGIDALKIEGRNKSLYYLATIVRSYRAALDSSGKKRERVIRKALEDFSAVGNREYTTGFALGGNNELQNHKDSRSSCLYQLVGEFSSWRELEKDETTGGKGILAEFRKSSLYPIRVHNTIRAGDLLDAISPTSVKNMRAVSVFNWKKEEVDVAHGGTDALWAIKFSDSLDDWTVLRKKCQAR